MKNQQRVIRLPAIAFSVVLTLSLASCSLDRSGLFEHKPCVTENYSTILGCWENESKVGPRGTIFIEHSGGNLLTGYGNGLFTPENEVWTFTGKGCPTASTPGDLDYGELNLNFEDDSNEVASVFVHQPPPYGDKLFLSLRKSPGDLIAITRSSSCDAR